MAKDKPLIFRVEAKDEASKVLDRVMDTVANSGKRVKDSFNTVAGATDLLKATFQDIKPPPALEKSEVLFKRLGTSATKTGAEIREAFGDVQNSKKNLQFGDQIAQMNRLASEASELKSELKSASGALEEMARGGDSGDRLDDMADSLRDVASGAKQVYDSFAGAGEGVRDLERGIKRAFADPAAANTAIKNAKDLKAAYGDVFSKEDIKEGIQALATFNVATEANIKRVAALAAARGKSFEDIAETYGEFQKAASGGKQDFGSTEELRSQLGIDPTDLVKYGAEVDKNNKLLGEGAVQAGKAQRALQLYIDESAKYQGVAERGADAQSKLNAKMDEFKDSVGGVINEWKNLIAQALLPGAEALNNLSPQVKGALAGFAGGIPALAGFGAKTLEIAAYAKFMGIAVSGTAVATAALGAAALAATGYVIAQIAAMDDAAESAEKAAQAESNLVDTQQKALEGRGRDKLQGLGANEIIDQARAEKEAGDQRAKLTDGIIVKKLQRDSAFRQAESSREAGHEAQAKRHEEEAADFQDQIDQLQTWRQLIDRTSAEEVAAAEKVTAANQAAYQSAVERFNAYEKQASRGGFDSKQDELNAVSAIIPSLELGSDVRAEAEAKQKSLYKEASRESIKDLQQELAEKKALNTASYADEVKSLQDQLEIAKKLGKAGVDERIRIYGELATGKAKQDAEANKKLKSAADQDLKDAAKVDPATKTFDRGTGQAVDAYETAIQRVKEWREENAKLIAKFPELGQKGQQAIEQLRLQQATAEVARLAKNFQTLQKDLKLVEDAAVTTGEKLEAVAKERDRINSDQAGGKITKDQATSLLAPLGEKEKDLGRQKAQEDLQNQQALTQLKQRSAEQELAIAESLADGTIASNDKVLVANEKLYQFKLKNIEQERDATIAAGQDKVAAEQRYQQELVNLERERTVDYHTQAKSRVDARRQELQDIINLNKPQDDASKTDLKFGINDNASFFSIGGGSSEDDQRRRETRRAEKELKKLDASEAFRRANPEAVAKVAQEDYQRRLRAADPTGMIRNVDAKMAEGQEKAVKSDTTVNNNQSAIFNFNGSTGKTVPVKSNADAVRQVNEELKKMSFFDGNVVPGLG